MKKKSKCYVEYDSNNSGGSWWLNDEDWIALEKAGWKVEWARLEHAYTDEGNYVYDTDGSPKLVPHGHGNNKFGASFVSKDGRYLGALAKGAYKVGCDSIRDAAA